MDSLRKVHVRNTLISTSPVSKAMKNSKQEEAPSLKEQMAVGAHVKCVYINKHIPTHAHIGIHVYAY